MSELGSIVEGDGLAQAAREAAEDVHDDGGGLGSVLAGETRGHGEAALALVKDKNGPGAPAEDQIALPVSDFLASINGLRPVVNGCAILDDAISATPLAPAAPPVAAAQIEPQPFRLLAGAIDEGVDRLRAQGPQTRLRARLEPARYLLWRPAFREAGADELAQHIVLFEDGASLPALKIGSGSEARAVSAGGQSVAPQFAADGGGAAPQFRGDGSQAFSGSPQKGDLLPFLV